MSYRSQILPLTTAHRSFGEVVIGSQGENTCDPVRQLSIIALLRSFLDEPGKLHL